MLDTIAGTNSSRCYVNRYSETNFFSTRKYHTKKLWRNFAAEWALGKGIRERTLSAAECAKPHREGESLMRNRQHTLLAGVAALALFAASGMAFAQQNQQEQKSAAQSSMQ